MGAQEMRSAAPSGGARCGLIAAALIVVALIVVAHTGAEGGGSIGGGYGRPERMGAQESKALRHRWYTLWADRGGPQGRSCSTWRAATSAASRARKGVCTQVLRKGVCKQVPRKGLCTQVPRKGVRKQVPRKAWPLNAEEKATCGSVRQSRAALVRRDGVVGVL